MKKKGQTTVEFLLAFIFSFGFFMMIFTVTLNYTSGFMLHLATFYAGRAYLVGDNGSIASESSYQFASNYARQSWGLFRVHRFAVRNANLYFNSPLDMNTRKQKLFIGAHSMFTQKLYTSLITPGKTLKMVSEAFLGKEPVRAECRQRICDTMLQKTGENFCDNAGKSSHSTLFDNGC